MFTTSNKHSTMILIFSGNIFLFNIIQFNENHLGFKFFPAFQTEKYLYIKFKSLHKIIEYNYNVAKKKSN